MYGAFKMDNSTVEYRRPDTYGCLKLTKYILTAIRHFADDDLDIKSQVKSSKVLICFR